MLLENNCKKTFIGSLFSYKIEYTAFVIGKSTLYFSPKNFIAYACAENEDGSISTIGTIIFAVRKQSRPIDYTYEDDSVIDDILAKITKIESTLSIGVSNKKIIITDQTTGDEYKLYVDEGKLNMEVV